ncbi:MAG: protein kinase domain-containing protein [Candidatus Brocadiia bacterium]
MGQTLGSFRVEEEISRGGMGAIYRATHAETGEQAAVKVLPPALAADRAFLQRFRREVRAVQQIEHPNVVRIHEVGTEGEAHYFAMEYFARSLADLLEAGPLPPQRALRIAGQVAQGLEAAHAAGITHRDIKPANILFAPDGRAVVSDFGIAKVSEATRMTQTGTIVGTPVYMSPEQAEGPQVDARSDIYSLGVVLYEMTAGRPPFEGRTSLDVLRHHRFSLPDAPKSLNPRIPGALSQLVLQMLEKRPSRRPPSMGYLVGAFQRLERNLAAREPTPEDQGARREPSAAETYERAVQRLTAWAKRLALAAGLALAAYAAYRLGAYLRMGPTDYLRRAQAAEDSDADDEAIDAYQALVDRFPETPEAELARQRIEAIEKKRQKQPEPLLDFGPARSPAQDRAEMAAKHFLRAQQAVQQKRLEDAARILRMVRDQYADTPWGPRAGQRLQELEVKTPPSPSDAQEEP